jgi:hypothetical protein
MSDRKNSLESYTQTRQPYPELQKQPLPTLIPQKREYRAYKPHKASERFALYDGDGGFDFYSYGHLIECSYRHGILTLVTTTRSFVLSGKNLDKLGDMLMDRKIRSLHVYNPDLETLEAQKDEVVIEAMEREE